MNKFRKTKCEQTFQMQMLRICAAMLQLHGRLDK